ncbi:MAG: hypothetical protein FWF13_04195 [Acidobacteria bacterium]|nr:hypothetical protein [Acidobacteriota bacterium]
MKRAAAIKTSASTVKKVSSATGSGWPPAAERTRCDAGVNGRIFMIV